MKKLAVALVALAGLVLLAGPASAKGVKVAHFSGPGLPPGGVTIRGEHEEVFLTGLFNDPKFDRVKEMHLSGRLGPAYRATYEFDWAPGVQVRQTVYPYVNAAVVTYTPSQMAGGQVISGGWWYTTDPKLRELLVAHGFPPAGTTRKAAPVQTGGLPGGGSNGGWPPWVWGLVAAGLTGAVFLTAMRQRHRAIAGQRLS